MPWCWNFQLQTLNALFLKCWVFDISSILGTWHSCISNICAEQRRNSYLTLESLVLFIQIKVTQNFFSSDLDLLQRYYCAVRSQTKGIKMRLEDVLVEATGWFLLLFYLLSTSWYFKLIKQSVLWTETIWSVSSTGVNCWNAVTEVLVDMGLSWVSVAISCFIFPVSALL